MRPTHAQPVAERPPVPDRLYPERTTLQKLAADQERVDTPSPREREGWGRASAAAHPGQWPRGTVLSPRPA
jgi:hypothetical protein